MLKNLMKMLTCFGVALVAGLLLMGNVDAKQQKKKEIIAWWSVAVMLDKNSRPIDSEFQWLGEFGTKEECQNEILPDADEFYTKHNQDVYPGTKWHVMCRPVYDD